MPHRLPLVTTDSLVVGFGDLIRVEKEVARHCDSCFEWPSSAQRTRRVLGLSSPRFGGYLPSSSKEGSSGVPPPGTVVCGLLVITDGRPVGISVVFRKQMSNRNELTAAPLIGSPRNILHILHNAQCRISSPETEVDDCCGPGQHPAVPTAFFSPWPRPRGSPPS